jgi:antitoxin CptB
LIFHSPYSMVFERDKVLFQCLLRNVKATNDMNQISDVSLDEARRKRLVFRAGHRGIRELDLLLGQFARHHVPHFSEDELDRFEALLDAPEPELYSWLSGQSDIPEAFQSELIEKIIHFHQQGGAVIDH